jgi:alpha-mannosidase
MFNEIDKALQELEGKRNAIKYFNNYKFFFGERVGLEKKRFGEVDGPLYSMGCHWAFEEKELWLKGELIIPERVAGISTVGTKALLFHFSACPSKLYVDGKKIVESDWWITVDVPLSEKLKGNDVFDITISYKKSDGNNWYALPQVLIERVEDVFLEITSFIKILKFLSFLVEIKEIKNNKLISLLADVIKSVPVNLLREEKIEEFISYIRETEKKIIPFSTYMKKYSTYFVGHAHIDMNWLWDWEETIATSKNTFSQAIKFMKKYPYFSYAQSQAVIYKTMEEKYPELFKEIKRMVKRGQWEVTASTWVEGDINMVSGESLVRQTLYAKQYIRKKLGVDPKICWCPDTFGHPASYPQILKKCGIKYYYFSRCGKGLPIFYWEGIDGSRVLAFNTEYSWGVNTDSILARLERLRRNHGLTMDFFGYGIGDHGGGPTERDIKNILFIRNKAFSPKINFSTAEKFSQDVERTVKRIPVVKDELQFIFEGCYTTHCDIKKFNRECENKLFSAEVLSSIATLYGFQYPQEELTQGWQNTCFNQFHDILDGSAIHSTYDHARTLAQQALSAAENAIKNATRHIAARISFPPEKSSLMPIVVFNTLSWVRDDVVEIDLEELNLGSQVSTDNISVEDSYGNKIVSQVYGNKLFIYAQKVPSLGYTTYFLSCYSAEQKKEDKNKSVEQQKIDNIFENERYLLEINPHNGSIKRLYDKKLNCELIDGSYEGGNVFRFYTELPHGMSAWYLGEIDKMENLHKNTKVVKTVKGDVCDIIETECKFSDSVLRQQIMFFKKLNRIEFRTTLQWNEIGTPHKGIPLLRVSFPLRIFSTNAAYEIPFGTIERPNVGQEAPALKWVDYSDSAAGVALLNDCKHGYNVRGNNIELTIIRSPYDPDLNPDTGTHTFTYALYPHEGDWRKGDVVKRGYELNIRLIPVIISESSNVIDKKLPLEKSFIKVNGENIVVSCLKKAENSKNFILRAYESKGLGNSECSLEFDRDMKVRKIAETDLLENIISAEKRVIDKFPVKFKKYEIKSYLISR